MRVRSPQGYFTALGTCAVLALAGAGGASAATVSMERVEEQEGGVVDGQVEVVAAAGEVNTVTVSHSRSDAGEAVTVTDTTAPLDAGERCQNVTPSRVRCQDGSLDSITQIDVALGDMDDAATSEDEQRLSEVVLRGEQGDDELAGMWTRLEGGAGDDVLTGAAGGESLDGGPGSDRLAGHGDNDDLSGGPGDDVLLGGDGSDTIEGGGVADDSAPAGRDHLDGGPGSDQLSDEDVLGQSRQVGPDTLIGGEGVDGVLSYILRSDPLWVDLRRPAPQGQSGENDTIEGVEHVLGGSADDVLIGTDDSNQIDGGAGDDLIAGLDGADHLMGGPGDDWVAGGAGGDRLEGGGLVFGGLTVGDDVLAGGDGNDSLSDDDEPGDVGPDGLDGGPGDDAVVSYGGRSEPVRIDLRGGGGQGQAGENDVVEAIEHASSGSGDDVLIGDAGVNWLDAGRGDDVVRGRAGGDAISGGRGADTLRGGRGADLFVGGSDDARDVNRCGGGYDFVAASDARDIMRSSCEDVGWAQGPMRSVPHTDAERISAYPPLATNPRLRFEFSATCTQPEDCVGKLELKSPNTRRLLGRKRFQVPAGSGESRRRAAISVRLNRRGQRRMRRGGGHIRVVLTTRCETASCGIRTRARTGFTFDASLYG